MPNAARRLDGPPPSANTIAPEELTRIRDWVRTHFGIAFNADKDQVFEQRVRDFLGMHQLTANELMGRMHACDRALTLRFAEVMSTNYTYFFRESESFDFVSRSVFAPSKGPLRVWCAAASSGDEVYSLAIAAREVFGTSAESMVKILGTDLSERQLKTAEQGIYPQQQVMPMGPDRLQRWMQPVGLGQYMVNADLKRLATFRRLNLTAEAWPFEQKFHLVFLRNVLYYFEPQTRRQVLERCYDATEPGGWLITSLTEPMLEHQSRWVAAGPAFYRKPA